MDQKKWERAFTEEMPAGGETELEEGTKMGKKNPF